jgi:hypothetical protein
MHALCHLEKGKMRDTAAQREDMPSRHGAGSRRRGIRALERAAPPSRCSRSRSRWA